MHQPPHDPDFQLGRALRAGAIYDWTLGLAILISPSAMFDILRVPPPQDLFIFRLNSLALLLLGGFYWGIARDPGGRAWAARIAIAIRYLGGSLLIFLTIGHHPAGMPIYLGFGAIDLAWGTLWLLLMWKGIKKPAIAGGR